MSDKFNLNFPKDKHDTYNWLMQQPNKSEVLIKALEQIQKKGSANPDEASPELSAEDAAAYQGKLERIFDLTIGHDLGKEGYGDEETFILLNLEWNSLDRVLKWRISNLRRLHPQEAEDVLAMWAKRYPRTYALARM